MAEDHFPSAPLEGDITSVDGNQPVSIFISPNMIKFFYFVGTEEESFYIELSSSMPCFTIKPNEIERLSICFNDICIDNGKSLLMGNSKYDEKGLQSCLDSEQLTNRLASYLKHRIFKQSSGGSEQFTLDLRFFSRNSRDIFLIACKLFRIVPVAALSPVFRQIDILLRENRLFEKSSPLTMNELLVEFDMLRGQLLNSISYVKDLEGEKSELQEVIQVLETDLQNALLEFKAALKDLGTRSVKDKDAIEHEQRVRVDKLNQSLISKQQNFRQKVEKNLDLSHSHFHKAALLRQSFQSNIPLVVQQGGQEVISLEKHKKLQDEYERLEKTKNILLKELTSIKQKRSIKKQMISNTLKDMSQRVESMNRDVSMVNQTIGDATILSQDQTSMLDSKMFDLKDMSFIRSEHPMILGQKKPGHTPFDDSINSSAILPDPMSLDHTNLSAFTKIEPRIEIQNLKDENNDLMKTIETMQLQFRNQTINHKQEIAELLEKHSKEISQKVSEITMLKADQLDQEENLKNTMKFVEDFRLGVKSVVEQADLTLISKQTSAENHNLLSKVAEVSTDSKLKLLNLENQSLLKRCAYLKGENDSLKDDIRELNLGNFHTLDASSRQLRNSQAKVSEHDSIIESQKKEIASLKLQVADVEMKLQGKNLEANDQPQTKNDTHLSQLEELNQKIQQLEEINKQIVVQRDTLDAMLFESSSKIKKLETTVTDQEKIISTHSQVDSQRIETNQETELKEVSKSDAICEQQQKVIESLTQTNQRLMEEMVRLGQQLQNFEDGRNSFISDSMNNSYMENSLVYTSKLPE